VLTYALNRRWTPPTPRLAVDGYWRTHPLRADRLARALAAKSGTPKGWTWEAQGLAAEGKAQGRFADDVSAPPRRRERHSGAARDFVACAGSRSIAGLARGPVGAWSEPERHLAYGLRDGVAAVERAKRPRQA